MSGARIQFSRRYRAAMLDYLLGSGETALVRAYDLGRRALDEGLGLLQVLRAHQRAVDAVLESTHTVKESLSRLKAAEVFLMETLSPFEMTYRGYVALLKGHHQKPPKARSNRPNGRRHKVPVR
jgi:Phosphoserine phosphatase RsbU, N-terminal domain